MTRFSAFAPADSLVLDCTSSWGGGVIGRDFALEKITLRDISAAGDLSRRSGSEREAEFWVRAFNVDDKATVWVNDRKVVEEGYRGDSGWVSIDEYLEPGPNQILFSLRNIRLGWTYGFRLGRKDEILWQDGCGIAGRSGCPRPVPKPFFDKVYEKLYVLDY